MILQLQQVSLQNGFDGHVSLVEDIGGDIIEGPAQLEFDADSIAGWTCVPALAGRHF